MTWICTLYDMSCTANSINSWCYVRPSEAKSDVCVLNLPMSRRGVYGGGGDVLVGLGDGCSGGNLSLHLSWIVGGLLSAPG